MPDRETVIKQIALCINDEPCNECDLKEYFFCKNLLLKNALALLNELEETIKQKDKEIADWIEAYNFEH